MSTEEKAQVTPVVDKVIDKILREMEHARYEEPYWRIVLLCDPETYKVVQQCRAEIQNVTATRFVDLVEYYTGDEYLEVIDVPQEYTVAYKVMTLTDLTDKSTWKKNDHLTYSGLFYSRKDAEKHQQELGGLEQEKEIIPSELNTLYLFPDVMPRDAFFFEDHDPDGEVKPGKWRFEGTYSHEQVIATHPRLGDIEVDKGIKQFIESIWELGYETIYSCEGDPNAVDRRDASYLMFPDREMAKRFVKQFGGSMDAFEYHNRRVCVRKFKIPANIEIYRPTKVKGVDE